VRESAKESKDLRLLFAMPGSNTQQGVFNETQMGFHQNAAIDDFCPFFSVRSEFFGARSKSSIETDN
jgi:hypothetical protein